MYPNFLNFIDKIDFAGFCASTPQLSV